MTVFLNEKNCRQSAGKKKPNGTNRKMFKALLNKSL